MKSIIILFLIAKFECFLKKGVNANSGTKDFVVDPKWATVGDKFFVRVTDKQHPNVSGKSSTFTVFKTQG